MDVQTAVAQIDSRVGDVKGNLEQHCAAVDAAAAAGAQLVVFPELSLTGYTLRDLAWEVAINLRSPDVLAPLLERSKRTSIALGLVESGSNHAIYNSGVFLEDGAVRHTHRKLYLPTYGMFEEGRYFSPGQQVAAFDSRFGRFGMLICEDLWHISLPYLLAMDGAEAILSLTASPTRMTGNGPVLETRKTNEEHHRSYARLLNVYVVFSNRVGFEDGVNFWGGSSITAPSGDQLASARLMQDDLITARMHSGEVERARRFSRHFLDERPEVVLRTLNRLSARP